MTLSILAYDHERRLVGCVMVSKWPSAGGVVPYFRSGSGMAIVQNMADAHVAEFILEEMSRGAHPQQAIAASSAVDRAASIRQIAVTDLKGRMFAFSGKKCQEPFAIAEGESAIVMGHSLPDTELPQRVLEAFESSEEETLPQRLLAAIESVSEFSQEEYAPVSGAMRVYQTSYPKQRFYPVDLRVDYAPGEVLPQLHKLLDFYLESERRDIGAVTI